MLQDVVPLAKPGAMAFINNNQAKEVGGNALEEWRSMVLGIKRLVECEVEVAIGIEPSTPDDIAGIGLAIDKWREGIAGLIAQDFAVGDEQYGFAQLAGFFQLPHDLKSRKCLAGPRRHGE
jgi:hypothetical protein